MSAQSSDSTQTVQSRPASPPPAPPPPLVQADSSRTNLLKSIETFSPKKLKKTETNDRSSAIRNK